MPKHIYYPYQEFREDLKTLTQKIDQTFDAILGIARGGLSMSQMLGEYYDLRELYAINTIGYDSTEKRDFIEVFNVPNLKLAKNVLVVDDIVDSGDTMKKTLKVLHQHYPKIHFYTASIFYKSSACIEPDFWVKNPNGWIDFFWSKDLSM